MDESIIRLIDEVARIPGAQVLDDKYPKPDGYVEVVVEISGRLFAMRQVKPTSVYEVYDVEQKTFDAGPADYVESFDDAAGRLIALVREVAPIAATARS